jgi:hypothetical protein
MQSVRFDTLARALSEGTPRRPVILGLATALSTIALTRIPLTSAKRGKHHKRRKRKKPLVFNEFGCISVGLHCRGRDDLCCSGICAGKKPKQGKRDRRRCAAHDTGGCTATNRQCAAGSCTTSTGRAGGCVTTTGNAPYCADVIQSAPCQKDADCQVRCGPLAACILCPPIANDPTGGRHCAGPGACVAP